MKKCALLAFIVAVEIVSAAFSPASEIKKGDSVKVTSPAESVIVKNLEPIKNKSGEFVFGDTCYLSRGGNITVLAAIDNRLLVVYTTREEIEGQLCPDKTIFFYPKLRFAEIVQDQLHRAKEIIKEKELIKELLGR